MNYIAVRLTPVAGGLLSVGTASTRKSNIKDKVELRTNDYDS
jgi:hypothetical protein